MINIDEHALEQKLLDAYNYLYGDSIENYLVIESIDIQIDNYIEEKDSISYNYFVDLRYGNKKKCIHIKSLMLNTKWPYDFIQGYFTRVLEEKDEEYIKEKK